MIQYFNISLIDPIENTGFTRGSALGLKSIFGSVVKNHIEIPSKHTINTVRRIDMIKIYA